MRSACQALRETEEGKHEPILFHHAINHTRT